MKRLMSILGLGILFLPATGCTGQRSVPPQSQTLNIGGATSIYPMMDKWSFEYQKATGTKISYQAVGSGAGIREMIAATFDFSCSDTPLNDRQLADARTKGGEVVHIPLAMGAVVPAYNLAGIDKPLNFTGPILADIYLGKITRWNDAALKEVNKDVDLPDKKIVVGHRSDGSGTTYLFADYLSKVSPEWKEKVGVAMKVAFPTGVPYKGSEGPSGFINATDASIGYLELAYAVLNNITYGAVRNGHGQFIHASLENVTAAAAGALNELPNDLRYSLANAPGKDAYPISGTNWAVVYVNQPANKKQSIVDFLTWATHDGQEYCQPIHYARLPVRLVGWVEKQLSEIKAIK